MEQIPLGEVGKVKKLELFSKEEIISKYESLEEEYFRILHDNYRLRNLQISDEQLRLIAEEQMKSLQAEIFGSSTERYKKPEQKKDPAVAAKPRVKKPSERYPNIPVREHRVEITPLPNCEVCGKEMMDSGMSEESEQLTVIPKKYEIIRTLRAKYRCSCQACITTAPVEPRIIPGSSYSDEMIVDVVLSKYCDLIPIERYAMMAARGGLMDLPPQSLIDLTHEAAEFFSSVVIKIRDEILRSRVLHADETPHPMLEGSDKKSWHLWGFSTPRASYFECHPTRSGDVASVFLNESMAEVLISDVFSGYAKAIKETNVEREKLGRSKILAANCNAHARRYFFKPRLEYPEAEFYLDPYHHIYRLEAEAQGGDPPQVLALRSQMRPRFKAMQDRALQELPKYPYKNKYQTALKYFLENYVGLTFFLDQVDVPIDNNLQERALRSPVVGRKTWYGTHSEQGAKTAASLFTIVETCKLNHVNPREYFPRVLKDLHAGLTPLTPREFKTTSQT
jgi:transposase